MNKFCDWLTETKVISVHDSPKVPVDKSLFNLAGHFDRSHMIRFPQKHYSNDDNIAYSPLYNVIVNVLSV